MLLPIARILHLVSVVICLIVIASFALFVIDQTSSASAHQQQVLNGEANGRNGPPGTSAAHKGSVRAALDDASDALTSPFSGVTSSSSSQWTIRIVRLALALALYGFGLSFVARVIRVRV